MNDKLEIIPVKINRSDFDLFYDKEKKQSLYYLNESGQPMPPNIIELIDSESYTEEDVKKWFFTDNFTEFDGIDEIRTIILSLLHGDVLESVLKFNVLEKISGIELYKSSPIGEYWQQGDVLVFNEGEESGETPPRSIKFSELSPEFLIRINSNIFYELLESSYNGIRLKFLKMGNASWYNERSKIHIEMVENECSSVFEAICFRNGVSMLPMNLS